MLCASAAAVLWLVTTLFVFSDAGTSVIGFYLIAFSGLASMRVRDKSASSRHRAVWWTPAASCILRRVRRVAGWKTSSRRCAVSGGMSSKGSDRAYAHYVEHPRFGKGPQLTGLNPETDLGTGNPLFYLAVNAFALWFALMLAGCLTMAPSPVARTAAVAATLTALVVSATSGFLGLVQHPYRTAGYSASTHLGADRGPISMVRLSREEAERLQKVVDALGGEPTASRPMMAFDELPGLILALDGRPVGEAWFSALDDARTAAGIDAARGDVLTVTSLPFNRDELQTTQAAMAEAEQMNQYMGYARLGAMALGPVLMLVALFFILGRGRRKAAPLAANAPTPAQGSSGFTCPPPCRPCRRPLAHRSFARRPFALVPFVPPAARAADPSNRLAPPLS